MSIKLPNGKISLTLPEQVGKNAKDIDDIKKVIDGLDSLDNVVIVPDMSHIMTADELKSVRQPVCFIVYNDHLYFKKKEESGNAYFDIVFTIVATTVISLEGSEIEVNLSNGALGITNSTVSTYSVTQIDTKLSAKADLTYVDSQLAAKANLSGAAFTGAITAPSIIEIMSGYTFTRGTNANINYSYVGASKTGNKLTLVIAGTYTRRSGDESNLVIGNFVVPQAIANKLYPNTLGALANMNISLFNSTTSQKALPARMSKSDTSLFATIYSVYELTNDTTYEFRFEVTFLLSDSLLS